MLRIYLSRICTDQVTITTKAVKGSVYTSCCYMFIIQQAWGLAPPLLALVNPLTALLSPPYLLAVVAEASHCYQEV